MKIHQIVNPYRSANTYILELSGDYVLIIDVGNIGAAFLSNWLIQRKKKLEAVVLTHEHSDHCAGINELYQQHPFELICTHACATNIASSKQNFSLYLDEIETFKISIPATIVKNKDTLTISKQTLSFFETPGHSPGSMCIRAAENVFTGDTLLPDIKTPLNFPHSSRDDYKDSLAKLRLILTPGVRIFPGHGNPFDFTTFLNL